MTKNKVQKGFTLIETMIYIALFAFIMTGALVSVYTILESSARNQTKAMVAEEGSFLIGKIDWALSGIESVSVSGDGLTLTVTKFDESLDNPIAIFLTGKNLLIKRGTDSPQTLNNGNVEVTCDLLGCFTHQSGSSNGINPESIEVKFTVAARTSDGLLYSQEFSTIKYLRK